MSKDFSRMKCKIMHFISIAFQVRGERERQKSSGNGKIFQKILSCEYYLIVQSQKFFFQYKMSHPSKMDLFIRFVL